MKAGFGQKDKNPEAEKLITDAHIKAVKDFGQEADIIGFHGQTTYHDPDHGVTVQIGDGQRLAQEVGIDVVYDFRSADVAAGGQGAPLIPLYHWARALQSDLELPAAIVNIGGVSNVTWIGEGPYDVLAFDCGPGNALMDDYMMKKYGEPFDKDGARAKAGAVENGLLDEFLEDPFFAAKPPKSLDRDHWTLDLVKDMSETHALTTLTVATVSAIVKAQDHFPAPVKSWIIAGGGRHNTTLMERFADQVTVPVNMVDTMKWDGDALEAEGFAYLAVRSLLGEPLSLPSTTGVPKPMVGGVFASHSQGESS